MCSGLEPPSYHCSIPGCDSSGYEGNIPWPDQEDKSCSFFLANRTSQQDDTCMRSTSF